MPRQTQLGKAFEYACLMSIYNELGRRQNVIIEETDPYRTAQSYFLDRTNVKRGDMELAANAATRIIVNLEPQLQSTSEINPLRISIQEDARGIAGDVRDIICLKRDPSWEMGISCKHNHSAVKHSRLSASIDFGHEWFGIPCSPQYFEQINPLFAELRGLKEAGQNWRDIIDKDTRFYVPLLNAFMGELERLYNQHHGQVPSALLGYLLGRNDFYKVITDDARRQTKIQAFNIYGTLNRSAGQLRPQTRVQQLRLPERINNIRYKDNSRNTIIVDCDNGWSISMRIHSASTRVEASLKFDVNLQGIPPALYTNHEAW